MELAPVVLASVVIQVVLVLVATALPGAYPKKISTLLIAVVGVATVVLTGLEVSLIGLLLELRVWWVAIFLLGLALIPPVAGLLEARYRSQGQLVYSTDVNSSEANRFPGHLTTNVLGALATTAFVWAAVATPGFDDFTVSFADGAAFNIAMPLAALVSLAFVRSEQAKRCQGVDLRTTPDDSVERMITGYSLRHFHQLTNTLYLMVVVFVSGATMLYLFAHTLSRAKAGEPLSISWQVVASVVLTLIFFLSCGLPMSRNNGTVWMTFVTGTPAALGVSMVWLALFQPSTVRNVIIAVVVGGAYATYCLAVILRERDKGEPLEPHYFSSVVVAFILATLLGAIYIS